MPIPFAKPPVPSTDAPATNRKSGKRANVIPVGAAETRSDHKVTDMKSTWSPSQTKPSIKDMAE